jgi:hypothetical protein
VVGDLQRDRAVTILRRAYADGYLGATELERRLDTALRADNARQIFGSVRGVPGGATELALEGVAIPVARVATLPLRLRLAHLLLKLALGTWMIATAVLLTAAAVWALAAGLALNGALTLVAVWLLVTGCAYMLSRGARRLSRP